ncbi:hypothetical protein Xish_00091 [Xenorhabdus ishibashii]|uniref:Uncharacterized protein n=1 Tax=Xenorhabdus ishibashii TaxID=1034471 RepID=A0A2D0KCD8_9GAMM|nr:hypothetical protein Xish_00091 [Xenorhabdus ishibashii]
MAGLERNDGNFFGAGVPVYIPSLIEMQLDIPICCVYSVAGMDTTIPATENILTSRHSVHSGRKPSSLSQRKGFREGLMLLAQRLLLPDLWHLSR